MRRLSDTAVTSIGLVDAERDGLGVRRVAADQRDIRAVQRRHDLRHAIGRVRRHDLAREIGGRGVRHGVMRVDDVEMMFRETWTIFVASDSAYCGSRNSGYAGVDTAWNVRRGLPRRESGTADRC